MQTATNTPSDAEPRSVAAPAEPRRIIAILPQAIGIWVLSGAVVLLGVVAGHYALRTNSPRPLLESMARYDGQHYKEILSNGYSYQPGSQSNIAFFPAFPLAGRAWAAVFGWEPAASLVAVANLFQLAAIVALCAYASARFAAQQPRQELAPAESVAATAADRAAKSSAFAACVLLAFCFVPSGFFFRMAYSEALFVLLAIVSMYAIHRRWPPLATALVIGLATATRPVGVGLLAPFALSLWSESSSARRFVFRAAAFMPLACWGLLAFMVFQQIQFGDPLAFVHTQEAWRIRGPAPAGEKWLSMLSWEPIWTVYAPESAAYWRRMGDSGGPLLSLQFANPIYFLITVALVGIGALRGWLSRYEIALSAGLLAIPYFTRSYEMCFNSQARFASVVFPAYLVVGHLLIHAPVWLTAGLAALAASLLCLYSAMFAAGYAFF